MMENFKKQVERRIIWFFTIVVVSIIFGLVCVMKPELLDREVAGFQLGVMVGLGVIASVEIVKLSKALKDSKKLKMLYHREHDERLRLIRSKAGMPMLLVTSVIILLAAVIAGYQNELIFYTLIAVAGFQLTLGACIKLYFMKTM